MKRHTFLLRQITLAYLSKKASDGPLNKSLFRAIISLVGKGRLLVHQPFHTKTALIRATITVRRQTRTLQLVLFLPVYMGERVV